MIVESEQFFSPRDLVSNTLSGSVIAAEQFKIFQSVVQPVSRNVMDRLLGKKFSSETLFHYVAVFKYFVGRFPVTRRDTQYNLFTFDASCYLRQAMSFTVQFTCPFVLALFAAYGLFSVYSPASLAAAAVELLPAVLAIGLVLLVTGFSTPEVRAGHRAVHRVFVELLSIFFQVGRLVAERAFALLTREGDRKALRGWSPMGTFMRRLAGAPAKALGTVGRFDRENVRTLFANFLDRHLSVSMQGIRTDNTGVCLSK